LSQGHYLVYQNSLIPLGLYDKCNTPANTTFVIAAGSAGEIGYCENPFWAADDCFFLLTNENVISKFLYYSLVAQQQHISGLVRRGSVPRLARDISRQAEAKGLKIPVLIEVNSAEEPNKSGVLPSDAEALLCEIAELPGISLSGLMTMGPVCDNPEDLRKYFRLTKKLFDLFFERYGFGESPILSMGMSDSYKVAIEEGSTLVRVGRKLFRK
jgi:hypothetical protein